MSRPVDLPTLTPAQYGRANSLRREVNEAKNYAAKFPNSAEAINDWLAEVGGGTELLPGQAIVTANTNSNVNVAVAAGDGAGGTVQVVDGNFTGILLDGAFGLVEDAQVITLGAETFTFTVVDNEITAIVVGP